MKYAQTFFIRMFLVLALWVGPEGGLMAQNAGGSVRARLSAAIAERLPMADKENHVTLAEAELGDGIVFVTLRYEYGTQMWKSDSVFSYLALHHDWLMVPIVEEGYSMGVTSQLLAAPGSGSMYQRTEVKVVPSEALKEAYHRARGAAEAGEKVAVETRRATSVETHDRASLLDGSMVVSSDEELPASMMRMWDYSMATRLPVRNDEGRYTVSEARYDSVENCVHLTIKYDDGLSIPSREEMLRSLVAFDTISLAYLAGWGCELDLLAKACPKPHFSSSSAFRYSAAEIGRTDSAIAKAYALQYIQRLGDTLQQITPMVMSENETLVTGYFDSAAMQLVYVYEYTKAYWPRVKQYLEEGMDDIRMARAMALVQSDAVLVDAAYQGGVTLRQIYRNKAHTDSLELNIAPWMWDPLLEGMEDEEEVPVNIADMDEEEAIELLATQARLLAKSCPQQVDAVTVLKRCSFDAESRVFYYVYEVEGMAMLQAEGNPNFTDAIKNEFKTQVEAGGDFRQFVEVAAKVGVAISYSYASAGAKQPFVVFFSAEELREMLY